MSEWMPIETAPKEQVILVLLDNGRDGEIVSAKWYATTKGSSTWNCAYSITEYVENPTHWMPLPEPPK